MRAAIETQVENFLATLDGLELEEALANVELDAKAYGWDRATIRSVASQVRLRFAKRAAGGAA